MGSFLGNLNRMRQNASQYRRGDLECRYPPVRFWIEPTSFCNLKCPMCPTGLGQTGDAPSGTMDMALFRSVIDEIAGYAVDINLFYRGESLINKQLPDMIRYASGRGLRTRLETNGTFLNRELAGRLIDAGLNFLSFSVDGYTQDVYESIRRGADFERTLANVTGFLEEKQKRGSRRPFIVFQVIELRGLKDQTSAADRRRLRERFRGLPLNYFKVVQPHRFAGQISEAITGNRYGYVDGRRRKPRIAYLPCPYLWYSLVIAWDGTVVPCCMDFSGRYVLGRAGRDRILDIWNGPAMVELRGKITRRQYQDVPMCSECDILWQEKVAGISLKNMRDLSVFLKESLV